MKQKGKFPVLSLGELYSTPGARKALAESGETFTPFLNRYLRADWGDVCEEDWKANDDAVEKGDRVLAVYYTSKGEKLWVITEWDRSVTTFLLPDEY